jgi:hypothetical protein
MDDDDDDSNFTLLTPTSEGAHKSTVAVTTPTYNLKESDKGDNLQHSSH